jgi:hypothetical protein
LALAALGSDNNHNSKTRKMAALRTNFTPTVIATTIGDNTVLKT